MHGKYNSKFKRVNILCRNKINQFYKIWKFCILNLNSTIGHDCIIQCKFIPGRSCFRKCAHGDYWLGTNCSVNNGYPDEKLIIPDNTIIGSGAVVTKTLSKPGIYVGAPAKY